MNIFSDFLGLTEKYDHIHSTSINCISSSCATVLITDIRNMIIITSMMVPGARCILMANIMGIQITEQMTMSQPSTMDQVGQVQSSQVITFHWYKLNAKINYNTKQNKKKLSFLYQIDECLRFCHQFFDRLGKKNAPAIMFLLFTLYFNQLAIPNLLLCHRKLGVNKKHIQAYILNGILPYKIAHHFRIGAVFTFQ